jgi:hypothetical protein
VDCTLPPAGQAKVLAAWARLIVGEIETPIASVAIVTPLKEDQALCNKIDVK